MILRHEVVTSDTDMAYDFSLTTAYKHTTWISICSHPIPPVTFTSPDSGNGSTLRNWSAQWVYFPCADYFKGKHKICSMVGFLKFFSFWAHLPVSAKQQTESESPQNAVLYSQLSSSRITWMLHTKLWKTTCRSSASHKTARRFLWHICGCVILKWDILYWHKSNVYS